MAITPRLDLRQGQSLVMTPQSQQSIKPVQLNNIELSAFIDTELEKIPCSNGKMVTHPRVKRRRAPGRAVS